MSSENNIGYLLPTHLPNEIIASKEDCYKFKGINLGEKCDIELVSKNILNENDKNVEKLQITGDLEETVHSLLSELIEQLTMKSGGFINQHDALTLIHSPEIETIFRNTCALKYIKTINFKTVEESTSCLINLCNLMWIHALLLSAEEQYNDLLCKNWAQRQICFNSIGYTIGQLGFVSLLDIHSVLFNFPETFRSKTLNSFVISKNPRIVFAIAQPYVLSTKITVIDPNNFDLDLKILEKEYLQKHVMVDCDNLVVSIPFLMYAEQITHDWNLGFTTNEKSDFISVKSDFLLDIFKNLDLPYLELFNKDIYIINDTEFKIKLEYSDVVLEHVKSYRKCVWRFCRIHKSIYDCLTYYASLMKNVQIGEHYSAFMQLHDESCINDPLFKISKLFELLIDEIDFNVCYNHDGIRCLRSAICFVLGPVENIQCESDRKDSNLTDIKKTAFLTLVHICNKIKICLKIILTEKDIWEKWSDWHSIFVTDANEILNSLVEHENTDLAYELFTAQMNLHPTDSFSLEVYSKYLSLLCRSENCESLRNSMKLMLMNQILVIDVCDYLIKNNCPIDVIINLVIVVIDLEYVDETEKKKYYALLVGLKIISCMPEYDQIYFLEIAYNPMLIIEQLILNKNTVALKPLLKEVSLFIQILPKDILKFNSILRDEIDELLKSYASKSLHFRKTPPSAHCKNAALLHAAIFKDGNFSPPDQVPPFEDWVPNNWVTSCMICDVSFSVFTRRHHCRRCGRIICDTCSTKRMEVATYNSLVRICDQCFKFENQYESHDDNLSRSVSMIMKESTRKPVWILSMNQELNDNVRKHAEFDTAPDIELCLSILELHSEHIAVPRFLFSSAENMLKILRQRLVCPANFDYPEVTHVVRSLLLASKLYYMHLGESQGIRKCEELTNEIDLLNHLAKIKLFPLKHNRPIRDVAELMKIRDTFLEQQQWDIALDISTKIGLECNSIWYIWGKSILKSGNWVDARDKFLRSSLKKNPAMLTDILEILYSNLNKEPPKRFVSFFKMSPKKSELTKKTYEEALYYLKTYGNTKQLFEFYIKNDCTLDAVSLTFSKKIAPKLFLQNIYIPHLKNNDHLKIHKMMESFDISLLEWKDYINTICVYCSKNNYFEPLYEIQCWTKDYYRAAVSCIMLYTAKASSSTYLHLAENEKHLNKAVIFLQSSLLQTEVNELIKSVERIEKLKYLNTIQLQIKISKVINSNSSCANLKISPVPTLFAGENQKVELILLIFEAVDDIISAYQLSHSLVTEYKLNKISVYCQVAQKLIRKNQENSVRVLLNHIEHFIPFQVIDAIVVSTIEAKPLKPEIFVNYITDLQTKIDMHIEIGWLKTGYMLAVKSNKRENIERIYDEAKKRNMPSIERICATKLALDQSNS